MKTKLSIGIWLAFLSAFLWSTGGIGIKVISLDGIYVAGFRALIASLTLLPFFRFKKVKWNRTLIIFLLSFTWMCTSFVVSTKLTTAANAIALQYTSVFWVFFIDELPREKKISRKKIPPLILVLIGIFFYLIEPNTGTNVLGNFLALTSGIAFGIVAITLRRLAIPDGRSIICLANIVNFIVLFSFMKFQLPVFKNFYFDLVILVFLGSFQIAVAYVVFNKALNSISALTGSFVALLEPVLNPIWVYIFLKEVPTIYGIIGWTCLMTSVVLYLLSLNSGKSDVDRSPLK